LNLKTWASLVLILSTVTFSEEIKITGKVTNQGGKPVSGAIITLKGKNLKDTTDTKGEYSLVKSNTAVNPSSFLVRTDKITMSNGKLHINLMKPAQVKIEIYDVSGNLLKSEINQNIPAGEYNYNFNACEFAPRMTAVRVGIGAQISTFRLFQTAGNQNVISINTSRIESSINSTLAKVASAIDQLNVVAPNCTTKVVSVTSYNQVINITMDTLPRFSFFVTSLKALRLLSKNDKGFGGDLRFGKTGQGAGLLGADSICSCIAEMSMPGARYKQWRAFLSVAKGPDGTQVNAIDRVGNGPWYDRLGRLLANEKSELLAVRPKNADMAIKNDLPNEDGVPNHTPDPAKGLVDNHMFITGSDTLGKLYKTTATCDDWTATTGQGGSKPRAGLSWPQNFGGGSGGFPGGFGGMKHWISVMDCAGCQPGIDSTDASMGGKPGVYTIGNGGGYGGFYCFGLNP
jgi:hypothetical protein